MSAQKPIAIISPYLVALLGAICMAAPRLMDFSLSASEVAWIVGPMIFSIAVISISDVTRKIRRANWLSSLVLVLTSILLNISLMERGFLLLVALLVALLAWPRKKSPQKFAGGWASLWEPMEKQTSVSTDSLTPSGWSYNPSSWPQRLPLVGVALVGFLIASYLAAYQFGWIQSVWDPFFGQGSERVLTSGLSKLLPVPDASLGALGYFVDMVTGLIGGRKRWATMPWIVILFGIAVGPLCTVSILLVILQPTFVGAWCSLCLLSALISILMVGPAMDEVLASLQFVKRETSKGHSAWKVFWGLHSEAKDLNRKTNQRRTNLVLPTPS